MGQSQSSELDGIGGQPNIPVALNENDEEAYKKAPEVLAQLQAENLYWKTRSEDMIKGFTRHMIIDAPVEKLLLELASDISETNFNKINMDMEENSKKYSTIIENIKASKPYTILNDIDNITKQLATENKQLLKEYEDLKVKNRKLKEEYEDLVSKIPVFSSY